MKEILSCLFFLRIISITAQVPFYEWAAQIGADSSDIGNVIITDANSNVYHAGSCLGTCDFDPGSGTYLLPPSAGNPKEHDIYISKLDAFGNLKWAVRFGDTLSYSGPWAYYGITSMDTDPSGNVYALGYFTGTVDFDPGPATYTLSTPTLTQPEIFLCKLDANGSLLWARHFTGNYAGYGTSLAYSPAGDIYMTGFFRGMLDADPGVGVQNYSSNDHSLFIIQLDISGNFVMGNHFQSAGGNFPVMFGWSIDVDASGNVYTAGNFVGTADFDPGIGTCMLTAGNASSGDVFVLKLNAAGNFVWAKQFTGEYPRGITIHANNVYVTGMFAGTTDFDPGPGVYTITATGPGTPAGNHKNQFLVKFDLSGNFVWAAHIGSTLFSQGVGLAIDALSNIYCTGYFEGPADFDPGQGAYTF